MSDVRLFQTNDGGEIEVTNGSVQMCDGLEVAAYLSLFGGNEDDSGLQGDDRKQWWGNLGETEPSKRYRSELQNLVRSLPLVPANLRRIEDAAVRDLSWLTADGTATAITAEASMPAINTVRLQVSIDIDGRVYPFEFVAQGAKAG